SSRFRTAFLAATTKGQRRQKRPVPGRHAMFVFGSSRPDFLYGTAGADFIMGREGACYLYGGEGDDVLVGGAGPDVLYGNNATTHGGTDRDMAAYWDSPE